MIQKKLTVIETENNDRNECEAGQHDFSPSAVTVISLIELLSNQMVAQPSLLPFTVSDSGSQHC